MKPRTSPTTGTTKKPTRPSSPPASWVEVGMPTTPSRRLGTTYFTTAPATTMAEATPATAHAVLLPVAAAHTRAPATISTDPGSTGTRIPTRPTAIARPASRSVVVTPRPYPRTSTHGVRRLRGPRRARVR